MNAEGQFWIRVWLVVLPTVAVVIISLTYLHNMKLKLVFENGYEEVMVIGSDISRWQKIKENHEEAD